MKFLIAINVAALTVTVLLVQPRATPAVGQLSKEVLLSETENAYNPIPSPDGRMIAYVRTGRWGKGSGGLGRSNLRSEVMIMDSDGRILTEKPLADAFLAGWTPDGKNLICYRDYQAFLVSPDGTRSKSVQIPNGPDFITERAGYVSSLDAIVWVQNGFAGPAGPTASILASDKEIANRASYLGEMLVASPDGRYIAAVHVDTWNDQQLMVYDIQNKSWTNLGKAIAHPDVVRKSSSDWDWMKAFWNPWSVDGSHLVFAQGLSIIISTPDGKGRQVITTQAGAIGLAAASPDGKLIAYVTFNAKPHKERPDLIFWGDTTIWVVPAIPQAKPHPVTRPSPDTTLCLRWLNNREIVFDRMPDQPFSENARLWKVRVD